jgi:hypothetical protein
MKKIYFLIAMAFMALTFTSCEDVPSPYGQPTNPNANATVDPEGTGTADSPFNIAAAIAKCKEIGSSVSSEKYYVKGYAATEGVADASYGNASFYMTDSKDGKGKRFYAYQVLGSDGQKMAEGYTIKVGDEVVIYGPIYNYNGSTPETASKGAAYIVTVNGEKTNGGGGGETTGEAKGTGTAADPYNATAANAYIKTLAADTNSDNDIYIKGKIVKYANNGEFNSQYGNASFYISEDGKESSEQFYVYRTLYLNNKKFVEGDTAPAVGDEVVICGKVVNYKGTTPETVANKSYIYSLNGNTGSGSGGGDTPTPPSEGNMNKSVSGAVLTFTSASVTGSDEVTVDFNAQGWEDKASATKVTLANGTTIEFAGGENTSNSPVFYSVSKGVRVYAKNTITVKGSKAIAKIVLNCDSYNGTDYVGNDMAFANADGNTVTICNDNTEAKGGVQIRVQTMVITFEGEGTGGGDSGETGSAVLENDFTNGQGDWTINNVAGPAEGLDFIWSQTSQYGMKATAYISSSKTNTESDSWLISPAFTLTNSATLTFEQAFRYGAGDHSDLHVMISSSYSGGSINASEWTELTLSQWPTGTDWNFITSTATIPAGTKYVAFRYTSTTSAAATWEIKTLSIK